MSGNQGNETQPLLSNTNRQNTSHQWKGLHTLLGILVLTLGNVLFRVLPIYYRDFQHALDVNNAQFSYIIIFTCVGPVIAVLIFPFINKSLLLRNRISIFSFLTGILGVLFPIIGIFDVNNVTFTLFLCCINRVLFGIFWSLSKSSTIDFATIHIDPSKQGSLIGVLELSWSFAAIFYFFIGYIIDYINWWLSFIIIGILLCITAILAHIAYKHFNIEGYVYQMSFAAASNSYVIGATDMIETSLWSNNMKAVFSNKLSLLVFLATFVMSLCKGSFDVIVTGIWMEDVYNYTAHQVAWISLTIFVGELIANLTVSFNIDKYGAIICGAIAVICTFCAGCVTLILFVYKDATVGGIFGAIIVIFLLYAGFEIFYITNLVLLIKNNTANEGSSSLKILVNYVSHFVGFMIGAYISPAIWNYGHGLAQISSIWIICPIFTAFVYLMIKYILQQLSEEQEIQNMGNLPCQST